MIRRLALVLVLVAPAAGCAVSANAFALNDEPAYQTSLGIRRSAIPDRRNLGGRIGVDRFHIADMDRAWTVSGDAYYPFYRPGYIVAGLGAGGGTMRWTATAGLGTELDMRERDRYWGFLAEGGIQFLGFDDEGTYTELVVFARFGLYGCVRPLPCDEM